MKATGIVRRIDDLGRVVIPKEIRRTLRIREGDPLEIFVDREGEVILKKYSPIGELGDFAREYADSLHEAIHHIVCISDRDSIIAVSGAGKKEFLSKRITPMLENIMEGRRTLTASGEDALKLPIVVGDGTENAAFSSVIITPIVTQGDPIGAVIIGSRDSQVSFGAMEHKMAETAAGFLAKQMEQ